MSKHKLFYPESSYPSASKKSPFHTPALIISLKSRDELFSRLSYQLSPCQQWSPVSENCLVRDKCRLRLHSVASPVFWTPHRAQFVLTFFFGTRYNVARNGARLMRLQKKSVRDATACRRGSLWKTVFSVFTQEVNLHSKALDWVS